MNNLKFKAGDRVIFNKFPTEKDWKPVTAVTVNFIEGEEYILTNYIKTPTYEVVQVDGFGSYYPACCFELYNSDQEKWCDIKALKQILLYSPNYIKVNNQEELRKLYNIYKKIGINELPINPYLPSYFSRVGSSSKVVNYDIDIETTCTGLKFYNLSDLLKSFDKYKKHEV